MGVDVSRIEVDLVDFTVHRTLKQPANRIHTSGGFTGCLVLYCNYILHTHM